MRLITDVVYTWYKNIRVSLKSSFSLFFNLAFDSTRRQFPSIPVQRTRPLFDLLYGVSVGVVVTTKNFILS